MATFREHSRALIVVAVVALAGLATVGFVTVILVGVSASSTPVLLSLFGFLAPTIVALLALLRTENVHEEAKAIHQDVNGRLDDVEAKVDAANNTTA